MQNISRSDLYFFNNQYNDHIVMQSLIDNREKNFYQSLRQQQVMHDLGRISGHMSDFKVNPKLNALLGVPDTTVSYHLDKSIVPYYNKKAFLNKYHYNELITLQQIMEDHNIFSNIILFQIGALFCFGVSFVESSDGCYIIIDGSRDTGLPEQAKEEIFGSDTKWYIYFQSHVNVYYAYKNKYLFFTGNVDNAKGLYYIPMSAFNTLVKMDKPGTLNEWSLYMSCLTSAENVMIGTTKAEIVRIGNLDYLAIDLEYALFVINHVTNCKCYLINEYRKTACSVIPTNGSNEITFTAPYEKNPIPSENIRIHAYDATNSIKLQTLNVTGGMVKHPALFTYTIHLDEDEELPEYVYIEIYESESNTAYDNIMKDLIKCFGDRYYTRLLENGFSKDVNEYEPSKLQVYDFKEFQKFSEYPDLRAFRTECLIETLHENPERYKALSKKIAVKNKRSIRHEYIQSKSPDVFNRSVMSNINEISDPANEYKFAVPMLYLKVRVSRKMIPSATIYVNGIRVNTERIHINRNDVYIYIKRSHLRPDIDNVIDLEVYLYDTTSESKIEQDIKFYSTGVSNLIPNGDQFGHVDVNNLLIYDKLSGAYLIPDEVTYRYTLSLLELTTPTGEPIEFYFDNKDFDLFLTADNEYFVDIDEKYTIIRKDNCIEDVPYTSNKLLDVSRMFAVLNTGFRVNQDLVITNTNIYRKAYLKDIKLATSIVMKNFKGSPDVRRFRVYYSGKLLNDSDYTISIPQKYGGDVEVSLSNVTAINNNREIIVEYLPILEDVIYDGTPDDELYHDGLFWFTDIDFPIIPDQVKIYVNGYRVPSSKLIDIGALNIFKLEGYNTGDYLQMFINANDEYPYDMLNSKRVINSELLENSEFREYMKNKK